VPDSNCSNTNAEVLKPKPRQGRKIDSRQVKKVKTNKAWGLIYKAREKGVKKDSKILPWMDKWWCHSPREKLQKINRLGWKYNELSG